MAAQLSGVFSPNLQEKISQSKILVVGAGGIGCEILKNLVLSGFQDIEIIDLDTIDVSNLNRQFLFHKEHVGKSKSEVARESALSFNPNVKIKAYHDSITTTNYGVNFFQKFNLVLNALDNRQARNHVNRMCLNADVPLIESGTAGYNGQVELIKKGLTQCYECQPKAAQKSYPGCTIRNTPSEPIHCIVWAKHLFNQLFGEANDDEDVSPDTADPEAAGEAGIDALTTASNEKGNIERINTRQWAKSTDYDPEKIFNKLFHDDIKYLLSMSNLWKNRIPPLPIKWNDFSLKEENTSSSAATNSVLPDQKIWSLNECANTLAEAMNTLKTEFSKLADGDHLVWDKDDKYAMDFVAACANIRARIFNIAQKSRFDIKSMAGNIIPAIATTNAITAGVVVMHAFKILQNEFNKCTSVYMRLRPNGRNQLFVPDKSLNPPNPKCYVCSSKPTVYLKVDTAKLTVKELRDDVLIKSLNMVEPDVTLDSKGVIVISSEEGETDCNNEKKLQELDICDGAILKVDDFFQKYELSIIITHAEAEYDKPLFEVIADPDTLKPQAEDQTQLDGQDGEKYTKNGPSGEPMDVVEDDDDDCEIIEEKRPRVDSIEDAQGVVASSSGTSSSNSSTTALGSSSSSTGESSSNRDVINVNLDSDSDEDCIEITTQAVGPTKRKTAEEDNTGEGPSSTKRAKIDQSNNEDDDDLIILDDD